MADRITKDELDYWEKLAGEANPGPWAVQKQEDTDRLAVRSADRFYIAEACRYTSDSDYSGAKNAAFIAAAREALPRLTAEVRDLQTKLARAMQLLRQNGIIQEAE
jgi:hypothetical protein